MGRRTALERQRLEARAERYLRVFDGPDFSDADRVRIAVEDWDWAEIHAMPLRLRQRLTNVRDVFEAAFGPIP